MDSRLSNGLSGDSEHLSRINYDLLSDSDRSIPKFDSEISSILQSGNSSVSTNFCIGKTSLDVTSNTQQKSALAPSPDIQCLRRVLVESSQNALPSPPEFVTKQGNKRRSSNNFEDYYPAPDVKKRRSSRGTCSDAEIMGDVSSLETFDVSSIAHATVNTSELVSQPRNDLRRKSIFQPIAINDTSNIDDETCNMDSFDITKSQDSNDAIKTNIATKPRKSVFVKNMETILNDSTDIDDVILTKSQPCSETQNPDDSEGKSDIKRPRKSIFVKAAPNSSSDASEMDNISFSKSVNATRLGETNVTFSKSQTCSETQLSNESGSEFRNSKRPRKSIFIKAIPNTSADSSKFNDTVVDVSEIPDISDFEKSSRADDKRSTRHTSVCSNAEANTTADMSSLESFDVSSIAHTTVNTSELASQPRTKLPRKSIFQPLATNGTSNIDETYNSDSFDITKSQDSNDAIKTNNATKPRKSVFVKNTETILSDVSDINDVTFTKSQPCNETQNQDDSEVVTSKINDDTCNIESFDITKSNSDKTELTKPRKPVFVKNTETILSDVSGKGEVIENEKAKSSQDEMCRKSMFPRLVQHNTDVVTSELTNISDIKNSDDVNSHQQNHETTIINDETYNIYSFDISKSQESNNISFSKSVNATRLGETNVTFSKSQTCSETQLSNESGSEFRNSKRPRKSIFIKAIPNTSADSSKFNDTVVDVSEIPDISDFEKSSRADDKRSTRHTSVCSNAEAITTADMSSLESHDVSSIAHATVNTSELASQPRTKLPRKSIFQPLATNETFNIDETYNSDSFDITKSQDSKDAIKTNNATKPRKSVFVKNTETILSDSTDIDDVIFTKSQPCNETQNQDDSEGVISEINDDTCNTESFDITKSNSDKTELIKPRKSVFVKNTETILSDVSGKGEVIENEKAKSSQDKMCRKSMIPRLVQHNTDVVTSELTNISDIENSDDVNSHQQNHETTNINDETYNIDSFDISKSQESNNGDKTKSMEPRKSIFVKNTETILSDVSDINDVTFTKSQPCNENQNQDDSEVVTSKINDDTCNIESFDITKSNSDKTELIKPGKSVFVKNTETILSDVSGKGEVIENEKAKSSQDKMCRKSMIPRLVQHNTDVVTSELTNISDIENSDDVNSHQQNHETTNINDETNNIDSFDISKSQESNDGDKTKSMEPRKSIFVKNTETILSDVSDINDVTFTKSQPCHETQNLDDLEGKSDSKSPRESISIEAAPNTSSEMNNITFSKSINVTRLDEHTVESDQSKKDNVHIKNIKSNFCFEDNFEAIEHEKQCVRHIENDSHAASLRSELEKTKSSPDKMSMISHPVQDQQIHETLEVTSAPNITFARSKLSMEIGRISGILQNDNNSLAAINDDSNVTNRTYPLTLQNNDTYLIESANHTTESYVGEKNTDISNNDSKKLNSTLRSSPRTNITNLPQESMTPNNDNEKSISTRRSSLRNSISKQNSIINTPNTNGEKSNSISISLPRANITNSPQESTIPNNDKETPNFTRRSSLRNSISKQNSAIMTPNNDGEKLKSTRRSSPRTNIPNSPQESMITNNDNEKSISTRSSISKQNSVINTPNNNGKKLNSTSISLPRSNITNSPQESTITNNDKETSTITRRSSLRSSLSKQNSVLLNKSVSFARQSTISYNESDDFNYTSGSAYLTHSRQQCETISVNSSDVPSSNNSANSRSINVGTDSRSGNGSNLDMNRSSISGMKSRSVNGSNATGNSTRSSASKTSTSVKDTTESSVETNSNTTSTMQSKKRKKRNLLSTSTLMEDLTQDMHNMSGSAAKTRSAQKSNVLERTNKLLNDLSVRSKKDRVLDFTTMERESSADSRMESFKQPLLPKRFSKAPSEISRVESKASNNNSRVEPKSNSNNSRGRSIGGGSSSEGISLETPELLDTTDLSSLSQSQFFKHINKNSTKISSLKTSTVRKEKPHHEKSKDTSNMNVSTSRQSSRSKTASLTNIDISSIAQDKTRSNSKHSKTTIEVSSRAQASSPAILLPANPSPSTSMLPPAPSTVQRARAKPRRSSTLGYQSLAYSEISLDGHPENSILQKILFTQNNSLNESCASDISEAPRKGKKTKPRKPNDNILEIQLENGEIYKPKKLFTHKRSPWINKRLYKYLETKLKDKYKLKTRLVSEFCAKLLHEKCEEIRLNSYAHNETNKTVLEYVRNKLVGLDLVECNWDFFSFCRNYLPSPVSMCAVKLLNNMNWDDKLEYVESEDEEEEESEEN
ncbi:hypothetical protein M8J77_023183 [Diaphorina citri]|nr:hypothetical protein M8J77_023183 [Diaphorina citri]